jgi:hypothetical protein
MQPLHEGLPCRPLIPAESSCTGPGAVRSREPDGAPLHGFITPSEGAAEHPPLVRCQTRGDRLATWRDMGHRRTTANTRALGPTSLEKQIQVLSHARRLPFGEGASRPGLGLQGLATVEA